MLTLMLLRHARAEAQSGDGDAGRALTAAGRSDAARLGVHLGRHGPVPALALVSAARRAGETFALVAEGLARAVPMQVEEGLYDAMPAQLRTTLQGVAADVGCLLVVGHNPGIAEAALALADGGDALERLRERFPPCGLAVVAFDAATWRDASAGGGRLQAFLTPDDLPER